MLHKEQNKHPHSLANICILLCNKNRQSYGLIALLSALIIFSVVQVGWVQLVAERRQSWKRIQPIHGGTVYGEHDNFLTGKSCHWERHFVLFWMSRWVCRDCGRHADSSLQKCSILRPRGKCKSFSFQEWEGPPRSASMFNPNSAVPHPVRLLTTFGVGKIHRVEYEQAQCTMSKPCFDTNKCAHFNGTLQLPMTVYAYQGVAHRELHRAVSKFGISHLVRPVLDPDEACLLVMHETDVKTVLNATNSWKGGANHYVFGMTGAHNVTSDKAFGDINLEMAAIGSSVATDAHSRPEYDIPLPLSPKWKPPIANLNVHRPRKLLLSFKGSIQDTLQPYYQHRWLAAEYWYGQKDVEIDVQCKHKTLRGTRQIVAPYDNTSSEHFDDLMLNATFGFCPGGSGVGSYRFGEVLAAGGIPVIPAVLLTPLSPEIDWSGCVIRISQARIIDLPRILRSIPKEEVHSRQAECQRLYRFIFLENTDGESMLFAATMKLWVARVQKAVRSKQILDELNKN
jgi:hypothetical protein